MNRQKILSLATSDQAASVIKSLERLFQQVPHLPDSIKSFMVTFLPWVVIINGLSSALTGGQELLAAFGIREITIMAAPDIYWLLSGFVKLVFAYLVFLAFPLLQEKEYQGWLLLFWSALVAVITFVLTLLFVDPNLVFVLIASFSLLYILFEIKPYYSAASAKKSVKKQTSTRKPA